MAKKQSSRKKSTTKTAAKKKSAKTTATKKSSATSANKNAVSASTSVKSPSATLADQIDLKQSSEYVRNNWWNWSVWIEAPSTVLSNIEYVNYKLHSTFPDPIRHHTNQAQKFVLKSAGWGEFTIKAEIKPKNGNPFTKRHWLTLEYPQPKAKKSGAVSIKERKGRPTVFLSAGLSDLTMANALAQALTQLNINVLKADEISADLPWEVAISEMIKKADLMVVLLSSRPTSSTIFEIYAANNRKLPLPIVPVLIGMDTPIPAELKSVQTINLKGGEDPNSIAPHVADQVMNRLKVLPEKPKET